ncbi:hypothetical protein ACFQY7_04775 [Actinomadura luteofluorescens]|uniref:hypothetical protein n=1 Tax=Actinomadura luteofluorescens TaxID=46163 RepID=UPI00363611E1
MPLPDAPGKAQKTNPVIKGLDLPGFVSIRMPGILRVAYPQFIHYEWYVPVDADNVRYVQLMVRFETGARAASSSSSTSPPSAGCSTASSPRRTPGWST